MCFRFRSRIYFEHFPFHCFQSFLLQFSCYLFRPVRQCFYCVQSTKKDNKKNIDHAKVSKPKHEREKKWRKNLQMFADVIAL